MQYGHNMRMRGDEIDVEETQYLNTIQNNHDMSMALDRSIENVMNMSSYAPQTQDERESQYFQALRAEDQLNSSAIQNLEHSLSRIQVQQPPSTLQHYAGQTQSTHSFI
jgi:IMP cyclohydrolase